MTRTVVAVVVVLGLAGTVARAEAGEIERLRAENARLQDRVRALEAENATLRRPDAPSDGGLAAALEQRATESVMVSPGSQPGVRRHFGSRPSRLPPCERSRSGSAHRSL